MPGSFSSADASAKQTGPTTYAVQLCVALLAMCLKGRLKYAVNDSTAPLARQFESVRQLARKWKDNYEE